MGLPKNPESMARYYDAKKRSIETNRIRTQKSREEYNSNPKSCEECHQPIDYLKRRNTYCSHRCSAFYSNRLHQRKSICANINCKKLFSKKNKKQTFCNRDCYLEHLHRTISMAKHGFASHAKKTLSPEVLLKIEKDEIVNQFDLKTYLIIKHQNKCQKCKWSKENPYTHTVFMDMHHVDGKSKNNRLSNVELLCPRCHTFTPNYGSRNKNSDRTYRNIKRLGINNGNT